MTRTLKDYQAMIKKAKTKEELRKISSDALMNDNECKVFSKKYDKIIIMCVKREMSLSN